MSNGNKKDIDVLRENIEHTRQRISGEIEAIGERLTPAHAREVARDKMVEAKDRAVGNMRGKMIGARDNVRASARHMARRATDAGSELPRIIRENPVPTAMLLVGSGMLAWWAIRRSRRPEIEVELEHEPIAEAGAIGAGGYGYGGEIEVERGGAFGDRTRSAAGSARERVSSAAESAKSRLSGTAGAVKHRAGEVRHRASHLAHRGREGATQAWSRSQDLFESNPLALGAVCFFTGIGIGMLLPHTSREDRVLGERRQQAFERARHVAKDAKDIAIHSAKEGMHAARETAKQDASERDLVPR